MAGSRRITIEVVGDSTSGQRALGQLDRAGQKTESRFASMAKTVGLIGAGTAILAFGRNAVNAAADTGEAINKVDVVFGQSSAVVKKFAEDSAKNLGISRLAALDATGTFGNLLTSVGILPEQNAKMSTSLVKLAGDLASFNNVSPEEALDALRSGLVGETEPLKRFGVNLNENTLKAKALAMGLSDGKSVLSANAKAQAAYALILEQTKTAQGDFARTSDSAANRQRILKAQFEDLSAKVGTALVPVLTKLLGVGLALIKMFQGLPSGVKIAIAVVAGLAVAAFLVTKAIKAWQAAQVALNVVMAMNPIILVVLAIAALVAIVILAYKKSETFRAIVDAAFHAVAAAALFMWGIIKTVFTAVFNVVSTVISIYIKFYTTVFEVVAKIVGVALGFAGRIISPFIEPIKFIVGFVFDSFNRVVGFVAGLGGRIAGAAAGMWDGIRNAFRSAINWIIDRWNNFSIHVDTHIPGVGKIGFDTPNIPRLHSGTDFFKPPGGKSEGLALLRRGERVTPAAAAAGNTYQISVTAIDPQSAGAAVVQAIQQYERRNGATWRS